MGNINAIKLVLAIVILASVIIVGISDTIVQTGAIYAGVMSVVFYVAVGKMKRKEHHANDNHIRRTDWS